MSTDLTTDNQLTSAAQYVKDQDGNASSLSLTKEGNVGVATTSPKTALDVNGTLSVKTPVPGVAIMFTETSYSFWDGSQRFRLQKNYEGGNMRVFEVLLENFGDKGDFFFDNVDVFPDNDKAQSLGKAENQWSELHVVDGYLSGSLNLTNLTTPPRGLKTVDIVMDPVTGKVYRKT